MSRAAAVALLAALGAGCATQETAPPVVKQAVAEAPCNGQKAPRRPAFPSDALTGNEGLWTIGTALWAERKARRAYEAELEVFVEECTRASGN